MKLFASIAAVSFLFSLPIHAQGEPTEDSGVLASAYREFKMVFDDTQSAFAFAGLGGVTAL
ncbi:MAG: hypothetical protein ACXWP5_07165 [Bdellovibrionota bacterium]